MSDDVVSQLAPTGVLRAGINLSNMLLVTGKSASGDPEGVSPDMARTIAERLGVEVRYVTFPSPGDLADAAGGEVWDIGLIAEEPARAEVMAFGPPYVEIEATYLVSEGSPIQSIDEVDREGVRIAISARSAYDLYLDRTLKHAELVRAQGIAASVELFVNEKLDVLAGLRPALITQAESIPGSRILDGQFTAVQQSIGATPGNDAAIAFLRDFIEEAKASGFVASLIEKHGVTGRLSVAPPA